MRFFNPQRLSVLFFCLPLFSLAQVTTCFEIESILVHSCAPSGSGEEGLNEMVRFIIGPDPMNTVDLQVTWATVANPWGGVCQDAQTTQKIALLNASITSCGFLKEPVNGIIPANSKVLLISGRDFNPTYNSFAGLTDTVYVIVNCASPNTGNFANYSSSGGLRTLNMQFGPSCNDQATYERSNLSQTTGATVNFAPDGTPSYVNNGCIAPFVPLSAAWTTPAPLCAGDNAINLNDQITGTPGGTWSGDGVTGNSFDPSGLSGQIPVLYSVGVGDCEVQEELFIVVNQGGNATWTSPGVLCSGSGPIDLNPLITGTTGGTWSGTGVTGNTFNPALLSGNIDVTYTVGGGTCQGELTQQVQVIEELLPPVLSGITTYCSGTTITPITATGASSSVFSWYSDEALTNLVNTGNTFTPDAVTTTYYVTQAVGDCISAANDIIITVGATPTLTLSATTVTFCAQTQPLITATSDGTINWFSDQALTILVTSGSSFEPAPGDGLVFYVQAGEGDCVSPVQTVTLIEQPLITAEITSNGPLLLCSGTIVLSSSQSVGNVWSTAETTTSINVSVAGTYTLTVTGACNTASTSVTVSGIPVQTDFSADETEGTAPLIVNFQEQSVGSQTCNWFINGAEATIQNNVPYTFGVEGTYIVKLVCSNSSGCSDSTTRTIIVNSLNLGILVPNSFTPNGDGFNNIFKASGTGIPEFRGMIFNRWGSEIFSWEGIDSGWDGSYKGQSAPEGVYFFLMEGVDDSGKAVEKTGSVTVLR